MFNCVSTYHKNLLECMHAELSACFTSPVTNCRETIVVTNARAARDTGASRVSYGYHEGVMCTNPSELLTPIIQGYQQQITNGLSYHCEVFLVYAVYGHDVWLYKHR